MSDKNLILVIVGHQGYIRHVENTGDYTAENDILFSSISHTYLPLIDLLHRLDAEQISFRISLVLSPILCTLLSDPVLQTQYVDWLDARIALGEREVLRCKGDEQVVAQRILAQYQKDKLDFTQTYGQNLLKQFSLFAKKGYLELLATAGSYAFFPHYADMPEVLHAQIEAGLYAHRHYFGTLSEGFWLPQLGYAHGVEKALRAYGINYTILDTHALLFSSHMPETGIFAPVRCENSLVLFARDHKTPNDIIGANGFMHNAAYQNQNKDIGFELPSDDLGNLLLSGTARIPTGYRYWAQDGSVYNVERAVAQAQADGCSFLQTKKETLDKAIKLSGGKTVSLVCPIAATSLGQEWAEGIAFLESVIRNAQGIRLTSCAELIENQFALPKITPYPSAANGAGYGEDLLDNTNGWMIRYTRKMSERMIDLAGRFPDDTGLKARLLNLGAKELMIAQESEWAYMLHEGRFPDYVRQRFARSILSFIAVFDSLGSNTVSTEWLTQLEREDALFPWMNYRIFSRKK